VRQRVEFDIATLVWTRGRDFPMGMLESRLRCPRCRSRRVRVAFNIPANPTRASGANKAGWR
jgi:hypothetical protein